MELFVKAGSRNKNCALESSAEGAQLYTSISWFVVVTARLGYFFISGTFTYFPRCLYNMMSLVGF